jgi:hypothetical protein
MAALEALAESEFGSGGESKRGDHGARTPRQTTSTHATAHGRRRGLRSPLLKKNGNKNMEPKIRRGASTMM